MKKLRFVALAVVSVLFVQSSFAQFQLVEDVKGNVDENIIAYQKYKHTKNDLTLIIHEDHSDPIVHVQVAYHVGSARESARNSGFAHFFEHMMFQGSKNVADEEHFKIISESGGTNNAYTSFDKTVYINTAPSNLTETLLWLEADRMGTHLEGFTEEKFNNQRDAVKNEKRQRYDNQPYGMVNEVLFKSVYPNHPYEWTPIGYVDDLDDASFDDLRNFFLRWYGPNNATLVVSGDVNPEDVKKWVDKYYGTFNKCPDVQKQRAKNPILPVNKYVPMSDNIYLPMTVMNFPTVANYHKDEAALSMLGQVLGGTNNSMLYKKFVKTEDAVQSSSSNSALELSGFFSVRVIARYGGMSFNEVESRINETFQEFNKEGVSDEALKATKMSYKTYLVDQVNSIASKATLLSEWDMMLGDGYNLNDEMARYESVTKEDIMRVFRKYILNKKSVIITVSREEAKEGDDETSKSVNPHAGQPKLIDAQYNGLTYSPPVDAFDRSVQPKAAAVKSIKVPEYYSTSFDNGLKIIGSQAKDVKKVYLYLQIAGGHLVEADKKINSGTASLTASLLNEGNASYTAEQMSAALDLLGSRISFGSGTTTNTVYIESFKENLDATLALLKETLEQPRFDAADFKRIKKQRLESMNSRKSNPSFLAGYNYNKAVYAKSVLAEPSSGTFNSVNNISLDDCKAYYNKFYSPNVASLSILGPVTQEEIIAKLAFLKSWENKNVVIPALPAPKTVENTTIILVDKPYAAQSMIIAGYPSLTYDYNGDYFKAGVMNFTLGGAFSSRINLNLREDKGYTYGARSGFSGNDYYGNYRFSGNIKKEATDSAIMEVMKELKNFQANGITDEELAFTKSSILLSQALNYETPVQKLSFLADIIDNNLPVGYTDEQTKIINGLSKADIDALATKYIQPNQMLFIVVGHAYKIKPGLEALGYGKIKVIYSE
ncbi:MAG: zinc protease [Bacteroidia bacterium]|jgi:zinc protease